MCGALGEHALPFLKELVPAVEYRLQGPYIASQKEILMSGMKSAYEVAMERADGEVREFTVEQKTALAEIDSKMKAKIAEIEIMFDQQLSTETDPAKASLIQQTKLEQMAKVRSGAESEKDAIRNG